MMGRVGPAGISSTIGILTVQQDERVFPTVVDWWTNASKDGMPVNCTYSVEDVRALDTHRTPIYKQLEMLLCLVGISRRYYLGDEVYPTFHYDDDREMDLFSLIRAPNPTKVKTRSCPRAPHKLPLLTLTASWVIEMDEPAVATDSSGVPSTIKKSPLDFANEDGASDQGTAAPEMPPPVDVPATAAPGVGQAEEVVAVEPPLLWGKSLAAMQLCLASNVFVSEGAPTNVSDPDPLSFADAPSCHPVDVAQSSPSVVAAEDPESENASSPTEVGSPGSVSREEKLKAAFEQFKQYEDERVKRRCAELDARLDALSIDFDEELYPHMLTAIAGRRWVVGHGLRLAMMKCAESLEMRQAFADVLEGLKDAPMDVIMAALYLESDTGGIPRNIYATSVPDPLSSPSPCTRRSDDVSVSVPMVVPQVPPVVL
nr:hypothetical protein [Tanacetum cinerariifolium]